MRRIYFLVPDIETTQNIADEFRADGTNDRHLHNISEQGYAA